MLSRSRALAACCIVSQSDWLPMTMPTAQPAPLIGFRPGWLRGPSYIRGRIGAHKHPGRPVAQCTLSDPSGDDIGQQLAFDLRNLVLEQQLSLLQALQLQLVEREPLGQPCDHIVEVAMLGLKGSELSLQGF